MSQNQTEQVTAGMVATETPEQTYSAGGYRTLAVIAFIAAVGGLFIGLLSKWVGFLAHSEVFSAQGGVLDGSLIGFFIFYARTVFNDVGILSYLKDYIYHPLNIVDAALLLSSAMTALAIVLSLVLGVVSFVSRKAAKGCAMTSAVFVFLGYAGLFATNFYAARLMADGFARVMFDIPTAIIGGVMLICLVIAALARRKGLGLLNFVLFLLTALTIYALCNTQSLFAQLTLLGGTAALRENLFFGISALALAALIAFNFVASSVRLSAKKAYVFDAVRFGLLLAAAVLAFVANGLGNEWALFDTQMLSVILMLAAPLAALLLSLVIAIVQATKARRVEAEETSKSLDQPTASPAAAAVAPAAQAAPAAQPASASAYAQKEQTPAALSVTEGSQEVAKNVTVNVAPQTAEQQPPQNVTVNVTPAMYGQQPVMPFYPMPYYAAPQPAVQPAAEQPVPAPAPQPEPAPEPVKEEAMSEFERSMAALAKGIEPETANTAAAAYQPTPAPVFAQPAPAPQPVPAPAYDATQYTYDSFINSLTPQEKNEFGDLFIANKYGDLAYLPAYVIGGDNREFFSKVFIYFGRFRSHISSALLDKLYVYVSRN